MVHWWMLVPSGKDYYVSNIQEISKSIATHGNITHGLEIPLIVMKSIYPDFFTSREEPNLFSDCLICMYGGSISSKNKFFVAK
jgi:hypothetical protein